PPGSLLFPYTTLFRSSGERLNIRDILKNGRGGTTPMTSGRWFNKEKTSGRGADRQARSPTVSECELQLSDVLLAGAPGGLISARVADETGEPTVLGDFLLACGVAGAAMASAGEVGDL